MVSPSSLFLKLSFKPNVKPLLKSVTIASFALVGMVTSVYATAYDAQDQAIVKQKIDTITQSIEKQDYTPVINMMPPKVVAVLSQKANLSASELKALMIKHSSSMMAGLKQAGGSTTYDADLSRAKILTSNTERDYLVIPTKMHMIMQDKAFDMSGTLLAIQDEGQWYMMRIDNAQHLAIVSQAYPDMTGIEIFEPKIKVN